MQVKIKTIYYFFTKQYQVIVLYIIIIIDYINYSVSTITYNDNIF